MKVYNIAIEMISITDVKGNIKPIRFRMQIGDEPLEVIKINKILKKDAVKICGNTTQVFTCITQNNNIEIIFELRFILNKCIWYLYKI
ncbi:MAG TPA: hypothetical protein VIK86_06620 [Candidatus Paceibacterota bacterium]